MRASRRLRGRHPAGADPWPARPFPWRLGGVLLACALGLAGCAGPLPDQTEDPEAGYGSQTERPPPAAPTDEPVFPTPLPTPREPPEPAGDGLAGRKDAPPPPP